jgi:hypothetical protein
LRQRSEARDVERAAGGLQVGCRWDVVRERERERGRTVCYRCHGDAERVQRSDVIRGKQKEAAQQLAAMAVYIMCVCVFVYIISIVPSQGREGWLPCVNYQPPRRTTH